MPGASDGQEPRLAATARCCLAPGGPWLSHRGGQPGGRGRRGCRGAAAPRELEQRFCAEGPSAESWRRRLGRRPCVDTGRGSPRQPPAQTSGCARSPPWPLPTAQHPRGRRGSHLRDALAGPRLPVPSPCRPPSPLCLCEPDSPGDLLGAGSHGVGPSVPGFFPSFSPSPRPHSPSLWPRLLWPWRQVELHAPWPSAAGVSH